MFRLHETTRRRVGRTAFVALCVAPMLATVAWILHAYRPWRLDDEQQRLSGLLHVGVQAADWREPRPSVVRTSAIKLVDPKSDATIAELTNVEWRLGRKVDSATLGSIAIDAANLGALASQVQAWLAPLDRSYKIDAQRLQINAPGQGIEFHQVHVQIDRADEGVVRIRLTAQAGPSGAPQPIHVAIERDSAAGAPRLTATIDASAAALPSWFVQSLVPVLGDLGADATFAGVIQLQLAGREVSGAATGQWQGVTPASLLPVHLQSHATGDVTVQLENLHWQGDRIVSLAGAVAGRDVAFSRMLVTAAVNCLAFGTTGAGQGDPSDMLAVELLNARFTLDAQGLAIVGDMPDGNPFPPGCVAASGGRPLLMQGPPLHPAAWVWFINGGSRSTVPATRGAVEMANRLPLPEASASPPSPK